MLYNLEPDRTITGGAWYSGPDFESEFVEVLNQQCFKFLQQKGESAANKVIICHFCVITCLLISGRISSGNVMVAICI